MNNDTDCKVCYAPHDEEIHEATLRIRRWLNNEVNRKLGNGFDEGCEFAQIFDEPVLTPQSAA